MSENTERKAQSSKYILYNTGWLNVLMSVNEMTQNSKSHFVLKWPALFRTELLHSHD